MQTWRGSAATRCVWIRSAGDTISLWTRRVRVRKLRSVWQPFQLPLGWFALERQCMEMYELLTLL